MSRFSVSIKRDRTSGFTLIPHPYNRAFIAQFSRSGIITRQFPRNMSERIRKTNGFRTGCARPRVYFYYGPETKRSTNAEVISRDTHGGVIFLLIYRFSFTDLSAGVQLSSFFRPPQLSRSHRHYRRSRHSSLRNLSIRRLVAGNNNLRHTLFMSTNLSKRRHTFS